MELINIKKLLPVLRNSEFTKNFINSEWLDETNISIFVPVPKN